MTNRTSRRTFLRQTGAGISFAALGGYLAACSSEDDSGGQAGDNGESVEPITVLINESPWLDSFRRVAEIYTEKTGNAVEIRPFPFNDVRTQALNAVSQQSDEFDLYTLSEVFASEFYAAEVLEPLTDIDSSLRWPDGIITFDDVGRWNPERGWFDLEGTIYGLPVNGNIQLFLYRRDLYDEHGLEVPQTWQEVLQIAEEHGTDDLHGYIMRPRLYDFMAILHGYGGDLFADAPDDYAVTIDDAAGQAALETMIELVSHGPRDPHSIEQPELISLFQTGDVLQGQAVAAAYSLLDNPNESNVVDAIDYAVVPRPEGGEHASMTGAFVQAIPAHLPDGKKQAALTFLRWLMAQDAQMQYAEGGGIVTHQGVYESELADDKKFRYMSAVAGSTDYLHGYTRYTFGAKVRETLDRRFQELFAGSLSVDDGLAQMRTDLEGILQEENLL